MNIHKSMRLLLVGAMTLWALAGALAWLVPLGHPISVLRLGVDGNGRVVGVGRNSAAAAAGIVVGDRVDIGKTPWEFRRYIALDGAIRNPGTLVELAVEHGGKTRLVALRSSPRPFTAAETVASAIRMLSQVLFIFVGAALVLLRPTVMTWAFYLYSVGPNVWALGGRLQDLLPLQADVFVAATAAVAVALGWGGLLIFAMRFPRDRARGPWGVVERYAPIWLMLLVVLELSTRVGNVFGFRTEPVDQAAVFVFGGVYIASLIAFVDAYRSTTRTDRKRVEWVMLGFALGAGGLVAAPLLSPIRILASQPVVLANLFITLNTAVPITVAYAVLRHRIIDVRFVLNRTAVYAVLLLALAALLATIDLLFTKILANTRFETTFVLAAALVVGICLSSMRKKATYWIDSLLFRHRHEIHNATATIRERIYEAKSAAELLQLLVVDVSQGLRLTSAAFFARCTDGGYQREQSFGWPAGETWHLLPEHPAIQGCSTDGIRVRDFPWQSEGGPAVAVPMLRGRKRLGLVLYGDHSSGTAIEPDELRDLRDMVAEAAFAYELLEKNEAAASAAATRLA